jgi:hypothetical protein
MIHEHEHAMNIMIHEQRNKCAPPVILQAKVCHPWVLVGIQSHEVTLGAASMILQILPLHPLKNQTGTRPDHEQHDS